MTDRTDRITLPPSMPRCDPQMKRCTMRQYCGRLHAQIGSAALTDYTNDAVHDPVRKQGGLALCVGFVSVSQCVPAKRALRPVRPAVDGL